MTEHHSKNWCAKCGYTSAQVPLRSDVALQLLRTNEMPPRFEAAFIRNELQRGQDMLRLFDSEIEGLEEKLIELRAQREMTTQFIYDHKRILSPFRHARLPQEIWAEIFHYAEPVVDTNVTRGIWQFGRVCSYWRSVLASSAFLWTELDITIGHGAVNNNLLPIVDNIISRSGNALLNLTLTEEWDTHLDSILSAVIHVLIAVSHRWRSIRLINIPKSHRPLFSNIKGRIPSLVTLSCQQPSDFEDWFSEAPSLQKVHIDRITLPSSVMHIPWSQLRDCIVDNMTFNQEVELLRLCTNLETYTLLRREHNLSDVLCMSKLHSLTLARTDVENPLLKNLVLPSLTHLKIQENFTGSVVSHLIGLLSRSSCTITALHIDWWPCISKSDTSVTLQFLSVPWLQNLTTLHVAYDKMRVAVVSMLTIKSNGSIVLPRLENLRLHPLYFFVEADLDYLISLIEMTRSRWHLAPEYLHTVSRLVSLQFEAMTTGNSPQALRDALAPLLAFRDEGLQIDAKLRSF